MLTNRMTEDEFKQELIWDIPDLIEYEASLERKFRRIVIKAPRFPVNVHKLYTSKRKNKWIIILGADSKKDIGPRTHYTTVCYYNTHHGYYAILMVDCRFYIYSPHFFSRYAERTGLDKHGLDLIIHFFRNNSTGAGNEEVKLRNGSQQTLVKYSTNDGVWLCVKHTDDITLVKTFITREMAKGNQIQEFMNYEACRKKNFKY